MKILGPKEEMRKEKEMQYSMHRLYGILYSKQVNSILAQQSQPLAHWYLKYAGQALVCRTESDTAWIGGGITDSGSRGIHSDIQGQTGTKYVLPLRLSFVASSARCDCSG